MAMYMFILVFLIHAIFTHLNNFDFSLNSQVSLQVKIPFLLMLIFERNNCCVYLHLKDCVIQCSSVAAESLTDNSLFLFFLPFKSNIILTREN